MGTAICCSRVKPEPKSEYVEGLLEKDSPMNFEVNLSNFTGKGLPKVIPPHTRKTLNYR